MKKPHTGKYQDYKTELTPSNTVLPEKLECPKLLKKFPAFYGTRRFITVYTRARHLSLSWARSIQSTSPHPNSRRSILILFSHLGSYRWISLIPRPLFIIRNVINFLEWGVVSTSPNPQIRGPPLVGCPRLLIQYIRSYPRLSKCLCLLKCKWRKEVKKLCKVQRKWDRKNDKYKDLDKIRTSHNILNTADKLVAINNKNNLCVLAKTLCYHIRLEIRTWNSINKFCFLTC
jgi:hypothetical protein